jgi:iron complex transport system substrate-binding protein
MRRALLAALLFALGAPPPGAAADGAQRIVSLSPDLTEILYGLGAFPRVVGVSNYDTYPPETSKLPHLGDLHSPSLEKLMSLHPDLVLVSSAQAPFIEGTLEQLGLRVLKMYNRNIGEVYSAMVTLGQATGKEREAAALAASTREALDRVSRKTAGLSKPRVLLIVDRIPGTLRDLYTATAGSYLAQMVDLAGGRMAVPPAAIGYAKLSKEDLLAANPDVILDFLQGPQGVFAAHPLEAWNEMPELKAVRTHRVCSVNEDYVPHASQRMVQTAELFARLIHPEIR